MATNSSTARTLDDATQQPIHDADAVAQWLVNYLAKLLEIDAAQIDPEQSFESFGLDSAATVGLTGDLSEWLGRKVDPTDAIDHPTIEALSRHLGARVAAARG